MSSLSTFRNVVNSAMNHTKNSTLNLKKEPFNILEDDCWQCDELLTLVRNNKKEEEFNNLAKETFMDNAPTLTEFNDWCRFDYDSICEYLGLSDEDDEKEELDESGTTNTNIIQTNADIAADIAGGIADDEAANNSNSGEKGWLDTTIDAAGRKYDELKDWAKSGTSYGSCRWSCWSWNGTFN